MQLGLRIVFARVDARVVARVVFFFSSRRRHTRLQGDWSSDVCSSDLAVLPSDRYSRSCSTRRKRVCKSGGMSEISSRNKVLPLAAAIIPGKSFVAQIGRASCRERV